MPVNYQVTNADFAGSNLEYILLRRDQWTSGNLWTWGANGSGQLGDGTSTTTRTSPNTIVASGSIIWEKVVISAFNFAGIKTDGTLWTSGTGTTNGLTTLNRLTPVTPLGGGTNWEEIAFTNDNMVGVKTDGSIWTWGTNDKGQLGIGTTVNNTTPTTPLGGIGDWVKCAASFQSSAAVRENGTLWAWGSNVNGALGTLEATSASRSSPITVAGGGTTWTNVFGGISPYYFALKSDNTGWAWGVNANATLGDATTVDKSSPVAIFGSYSWKSLAGGVQHAAGIQTDGTLWTWGGNSAGELGNGTTIGRTTPVPVAGGGTLWKQVSCGYRCTGAIKTDGTMWTWGFNKYGQLGNGGTASRSSPVLMDFGAGAGTNTINNWQTVSFGGVSQGASLDNTSVAAISEDVTIMPIINVYAAAGTFTETIPQGMSSVIIEAWGGGGGGGGCGGPDAVGSFSDGGIGGGGGYARSYLDVRFCAGQTFSVTVGLAGSEGGNAVPEGAAGADATDSTVTNGTYTTSVNVIGGLGTGGGPGNITLGVGADGVQGGGTGGNLYNSSAFTSVIGRNSVTGGTGGQRGFNINATLSITPKPGTDGKVIFTYQ